jgi:flagellar basal-body rod protein FlgF
VPTGAEVSIGFDGTLSAKLGKQPASTVGRLKLATPTAEDPLKRGDDGLFRALSGDPLPNDANARLAVGVLEGSNVNPIEAMVGMIQTARQFEVQMRLLQTAESNDRSAGQLLGMQG